jgi:hypothetical protein
MKITLHIILILVITLTSCNIRQEKSGNDNSHIRNPISQAVKNNFNFSQLPIKQQALGFIKIGSDLNSIDTLLTQLDKTEIEAWNFGFDGGGMAYLYSLSDNPVFGIITAFETDSIIAIAAIHNNLNSNKGISPKMTAEELVKHYPNELVFEELLTGREVMYDSNNNWSFIFDTDSSNRLAQYLEIEVGVKPKNLTPEIDLILIR